MSARRSVPPHRGAPTKPKPPPVPHRGPKPHASPPSRAMPKVAPPAPPPRRPPPPPRKQTMEVDAAWLVGEEERTSERAPRRSQRPPASKRPAASTRQPATQPKSPAAPLQASAPVSRRSLKPPRRETIDVELAWLEPDARKDARTKAQPPPFPGASGQKPRGKLPPPLPREEPPESRSSRRRSR